MKKKFYVIYQITNLVNGKIYIGKHKTDRLDDDYMGSGKYLHNAFKKYGFENFIMTILFYLQNEEEMNLLEKMVVTKEFCDREDTYNIKEGGDGGWDYVNDDLHLNGNKMFMKNKSREEQLQIASNGGKQTKKNRELYSKEQLEVFHEMRSRIAYYGFSQSFKGKHHSEETKQKIGLKSSLRESGSGNSMYGMKWIFNDNLQLSFPVQEALFWDYIGEGWRKGRCIKYIQNMKKILKS